MKNKNLKGRSKRQPLTAIESYHKCLQTDMFQVEELKVIDALRVAGPVNSRMLSRITNIERTNITRTLYNLINRDKPVIKIAEVKECNVTGRRVNHYGMI